MSGTVPNARATRSVLVALLVMHADGALVATSQRKIAARAEISERHIGRIVEHLEERRVIVERRPVRGHGPGQFRFGVDVAAARRMLAAITLDLTSA